MINILRVDDRLVHGQVVMQWTGRYGIEAIVVANDMCASDQVRVMAAKMAAPPNVKVVVKTIDDAIKVLNNPQGDSMKMMVICNCVEDALKVCEGTKKVQRVNLGNYGFKFVGTKPGFEPENVVSVAKDVVLGKDDQKCVNKMIEMGVPVDAQNTPQSGTNEVKSFVI